jgi:uncharacterized protein (TIGR00730 family)
MADGRMNETKPASGIRTICVYCGSEKGNDPVYAAAARAFGRILAEHGIGLVFGGGGIGLMGELARSVLRHGGHVTGVIPSFLVMPEIAMHEAQELIVTTTMHERKLIMFERSDAFVALPGGIGTLEELVEQLTWTQLGQHHKPALLLNLLGYWDPLLRLFEHMRTNGFISTRYELSLHVVEQIAAVLPYLARLKAPSPTC